MATPTTKEIDRRLLDYGSPQGDAAHRQGGSPQRLRLVNCRQGNGRRPRGGVRKSSAPIATTPSPIAGSSVRSSSAKSSTMKTRTASTRTRVVSRSRIMEREAEVMRWHAKLPKKERLAWNHPTSIWRHFDKEQKKKPRQSASHPTLIRILHSCVDAKCDHFNLVKHLRE